MKKYGIKLMLAYASALDNNNNNNIKTSIAQDHQIRMHPIMHTSFEHSQNQQQPVNFLITRCVEDHSSQTKTTSQRMEREKVAGTSEANEL